MRKGTRTLFSLIGTLGRRDFLLDLWRHIDVLWRHKDATRKEQPYAKTLDQYLDGVAHRQSPKDSGKPFKGTIISIDVANSIAITKVHVKMYEFNYDEFLSFHKIDNRWLIVNKMITDVPE